MKKITCFIIAILFHNVSASAQCEATIQNSTNPVVSADNSGAVTPLVALFNNEYTVLNTLIIDDTYTITVDQDLNPPITEAFITLRNSVNNSVIAFGYTPLTFTSSTTEVEVHFFDEANCVNNFDIVVLALQNESTLNIEEQEIGVIKIYPNPVANSLKINLTTSTIINKLIIYDLNGKEVMSLHPKENNIEIDISNLKAGMYFLKGLSQNGVAFSKKILKQ